MNESIYNTPILHFQTKNLLATNMTFLTPAPFSLPLPGFVSRLYSWAGCPSEKVELYARIDGQRVVVQITRRLF